MKKLIPILLAVFALASCEKDGSVVILGGLTFVNFPLCIHLC